MLLLLEFCNLAVRFSVKPSPPKILSATRERDGTVVMKWDAPQNTGGAEITGYALFQRSTTHGDWQEIDRVPGTSTQYTYKNLLPGSWQFAVSAVNTAGDGYRMDWPLTVSIPKAIGMRIG